ncbi:hypothetical protein BGZ94_003529 [Podila epigama]|nr:hypothetical protein BGZ94_003529 [Podila epigama]
MVNPTLQASLRDLSPANPAILFQPEPNAICTSIILVSSARTVEGYFSGEYAGTFRGEPFEPTDPLPPSTKEPQLPPLFIIALSPTEMSQNRSFTILFKFFIPKKPVQFKDTLTLHWLTIQGRTSSPLTTPTPTSPSSSSSTETTTTLLPPPTTTTSTTPEASSVSSASVMSHFAASKRGIDFAKVRDMLGQSQIESLPKGAQQLMKAMEKAQSSSTSTSTLPIPSSTLSSALPSAAAPSAFSMSQMSQMMQMLHFAPTILGTRPQESGGVPPAIPSSSSSSAPVSVSDSDTASTRLPPLPPSPSPTTEHVVSETQAEKSTIYVTNVYDCVIV